MQQGEHDLTYYNEMMVVWQELDLFEEEEWESLCDSAQYRKMIERSWVFSFLAGLNKELGELWGCVLGQKPLPTIRAVFSELHREAWRQVVLKNISETKIENEGSDLVARSSDLEGD